MSEETVNSIATPEETEPQPANVSDPTPAEEETLVAAEHRAILEAFRDGDGEGARAAVLQHLEAARSRLLKGAAVARAQAGEAGRPKKR